MLGAAANSTTSTSSLAFPSTSEESIHPILSNNYDDHHHCHPLVNPSNFHNSISYNMMLPTADNNPYPSNPLNPSILQSLTNPSSAYPPIVNNLPPDPALLIKPIHDCPEIIRWMYKNESDKTWNPFSGYDSMQLEQRYQEIKDSLQYPLGIRATTTTTTNIIETNSIGGSSSCCPSSNNTNEFSSNPASETRRFSLVSKTIFSTNENNSSSGTTAGGFSWKQIKSIGSNIDPNNSGKWFNNSIWSTTNTTEESNNGLDPQQQQQRQEATAGPATTATYNNDDEAWLHDKSKLSSTEPPPAHIVIVRSGLYEADLQTWACKSIFWPGDSSELIRGTWFQEGVCWEPLPMDYAAALEQEHLEKFSESSTVAMAMASSSSSSYQYQQQSIQFHSLPESPTRKLKSTIVHRVTFPEYHIDWTSATDIHLYRKKSSSIFMKSVSQKLGFQWGERISRGYFSPAELTDKPPEIGHVVFVVHGIGQKMDGSRIVRNCSTIRENMNNIQKKYFNEESSSGSGGADNNNKIAVIFPIEWRSSLRLDGDVVDSITPNKILGLRQLLNTTAMDIMYYTSPLYRTEIQSALRVELNRTYANFIARNPNFETNGGKFSILAHSLGAVITYDIITSPLLTQGEDWPEGRIEERVAGAPPPTEQQPSNDNNHQLEFDLEHFFCLGSPLSVFLALRWREPSNPALRPFILPSRLCRRMYNIFNLNDPIAYRLEPLLNKNYINIPPVAIINHASSPTLKFDEMIREIVNKDLMPGDLVELRKQYSSSSTTTTTTAAEAAASMVDSTCNMNMNSSCSSDQLFEVVRNANYFNSESEYGLRSPPSSSQTAPAGSDSFFTAIYNYWNNKQQQSGATFTQADEEEQPNEMEVAAAKLDSLNFSMMNSLVDEEVGGPPYTASINGTTRTSSSDHDHESLSMKMNLDSEEYNLAHSSCYSSTGSDFTSPPSEACSIPPQLSLGAGGAGAGTLAPIPNDLDYRIDFVQRESNLPIPTGYLAALTSHTSYWSSPDIGYFILSHLYNRIPPNEKRKDSINSPQ